ncbi:hypothetical protein FSO04_45320 [Paraburkholderia madseniana]|uniref:Uncharacterized protein n=1 Tax=Paraburkholderia madseniana TaxID=2599607 RepID=A0A6N6VXZ4_9BURK|nr:hypothetical protein [Paraburkholderia madseniana]KAE8753415.1 hypothetical protein FSO04_45320 [Paraburkholderia madseniana]
MNFSKMKVATPRLDRSIANRALALRNLNKRDEIPIEVDRLTAETKAKLVTLFTLPGATSAKTALLDQVKQQSEQALPFIDKAKDRASPVTRMRPTAAALRLPAAAEEVVGPCA